MTNLMTAYVLIYAFSFIETGFKCELNVNQLESVSVTQIQYKLFGYYRA